MFDRRGKVANERTVMRTVEETLQAAASRPRVGPRFFESGDLRAVERWLWRQLSQAIHVNGIELTDFDMEFELDGVTPGAILSARRLVSGEASALLQEVHVRRPCGSAPAQLESRGSIIAVIRPRYEAGQVTSFNVRLIAPHVMWVTAFNVCGRRLSIGAEVSFVARRPGNAGELPK